MGRQVEVTILTRMIIDTQENYEWKAEERVWDFVGDLLAKDFEEPAGYDDLEIVYEPDHSVQVAGRSSDCAWYIRRLLGDV